MDKEVQQSYAARVTQANRSELVTIVFEIILRDIEEAKKAFAQKDAESFLKDLKQAQRFVTELIDTLDFNYPVSKDLMQLYIYVNQKIASALAKHEPDEIDDAKLILEQLKVGFDAVEKEDKSDPVMKNTQQLYAGLTYGKGTLNETFIDANTASRGFKA